MCLTLAIANISSNTLTSIIIFGQINKGQKDLFFPTSMGVFMKPHRGDFVEPSYRGDFAKPIGGIDKICTHTHAHFGLFPCRYVGVLHKAFRGFVKQPLYRAS